MSAVTSFSPPPSHIQSSTEHLSVHTLVDSVTSRQSLPSAVESIDEVQMDLEAQFDEASAGEDRAQSDHLDADPSAIPQDAPNNHVSNEESTHNPVTPEEVLEALDEACTRAVASGGVSIDPVASIPELTQEPAQVDAATDISFSNTVHTTTFESATLEPAPANDTIDRDPAFPEENGGVGPYEADELEVTSLDERDIPALVQDLAREIEIELETDPGEEQPVEGEIDQELNYLDPQTVEIQQPDLVEAQSSAPGPQDIDEGGPSEAEPLRRMDGETIPVTAHSKDSIIGILDDALASVADESLQATVEGHLVEHHTAIPVETATSPEIQIADTTPAERPKERTPASIMASLEHIQVFEPGKDADGPLDGEDTTMEVEPPVQEVVGNGDGDVIMDHPSPTVEEPAPAVEVEVVTVVEASTTVPEDPTLSDDAQVEATSTTEQVTMSIEETTVEPAEGTTVEHAEETTIEHTEQTVVEQVEQPEPGSQVTIEPAPEITNTDITITTTSGTTTIVPTEGAPTDLSASALDADNPAETEQIQQEQGTGAETPVDEEQGVPVAGDSTVADATQNQETLPTPDETAPKDSGEPLRAEPEVGPEVAETNLGIETAGPIDPAITQVENVAATTSAEDPLPEPSIAQYQIVPDVPPAAPPGLFDQPTPEWEGFAALDEDAPGSPEIADRSSEISDHPDLAIVDPTTNSVSASAGEAPDASVAVNDSPKPTTTRGLNQKRRMIMEVVIPIPANKPKTIKQESPRGRSTSRSKAAISASSSTPSPKIDHSSERRSRSASTSSGAPTPSSSKDKGKSPARPAPRPRPRARDPRRPFGARKRTPKKPGKKHTPTVHVARPLKVEVVMSTTRPKPRQSLLRRTGSMASGNNVKFAPTVPVTRKRKAESEPEEEVKAEEDDLDADAEGETDDDYEDVEDVKVELPKPRAKKPKTSPVKRPRRSLEARKMPTKLPEVLTGNRSPAAKRRRLRR